MSGNGAGLALLEFVEVLEQGQPYAVPVERGAACALSLPSSLQGRVNAVPITTDGMGCCKRRPSSAWEPRG